MTCSRRKIGQRDKADKRKRLIEGAVSTVVARSSRHAHDPSKMDKKIPKGSSIFLFLISVQTKFTLQSSEFLLTKENFFSNDVHQGPLSVDLDDSR